MEKELSPYEVLRKKEIKEQPKPEKKERICRKWMEEIEKRKGEKENKLNSLKLEIEKLEIKLNRLEDDMFIRELKSVVTSPLPEFKELIKDIEDPEQISAAHKKEIKTLTEELEDKPREKRELQGQIGFLNILLQNLRRQYGP